MNLLTIFLIFLIIGIGCYIIYKYVERPVKTWLLWFIGFAVTFWILNLLGFIDLLRGTKV